VRTRPVRNSNGQREQKTVWLCAKCVGEFELRFDRRTEDFELVRRRAA